MKKTLYVLTGFAFCVAIPALAENYRASSVHVLTSNSNLYQVAYTPQR